MESEALKRAASLKKQEKCAERHSQVGSEVKWFELGAFVMGNT